MGHMSHRDWQTKQWVLQGLIRVRASHEISLSLCHGCALQESLYGMHVLSNRNRESTDRDALCQ